MFVRTSEDNDHPLSTSLQQNLAESSRNYRIRSRCLQQTELPKTIISRPNSLRRL